MGKALVIENRDGEKVTLPSNVIKAETVRPNGCRVIDAVWRTGDGGTWKETYFVDRNGRLWGSAF